MSCTDSVPTDGRLPELRAPTDVCSEAQSASSSRGVNRRERQTVVSRNIEPDPALHFMSQHFLELQIDDTKYFDFIIFSF